MAYALASADVKALVSEKDGYIIIHVHCTHLQIYIYFLSPSFFIAQLYEAFKFTPFRWMAQKP